MKKLIDKFLKPRPGTLSCYPVTKIYIFCPAASATGGPEALHQLGAHLKMLGFNAFMYYYFTSDKQSASACVHENYKKYNVPQADTLENRAEHIMILPETHLSPVFDENLKFIRKVIWWLSVVNYYITQKNLAESVKDERFSKLRQYFGGLGLTPLRWLKKQKNIVHISHSYFSKAHLLSKNIKPIGRISDYMNSAFFDLVNDAASKQDMIIYNPQKNDEFLDEIMQLTPKLNWVPVKDMTPVQVAHVMNSAKLYIDFGYHPGKERMPREACIMRCCLIVGKSGSAAYQEDIPIPDKYRFEKSRDQIPVIIQRINECLTRYDELAIDFKPYREALYREEEEFTADIKKIFIKVKG